MVSIFFPCYTEAGNTFYQVFLYTCLIIPLDKAQILMSIKNTWDFVNL